MFGKLYVACFMVLGLYCDGLAANGRLFQLHDGSNDLVYKGTHMPMMEEDLFI